MAGLLSRVLCLTVLVEGFLSESSYGGLVAVWATFFLLIACLASWSGGAPIYVSLIGLCFFLLLWLSGFMGATLGVAVAILGAGFLYLVSDYVARRVAAEEVSLGLAWSAVSLMSLGWLFFGTALGVEGLASWAVVFGGWQVVVIIGLFSLLGACLGLLVAGLYRLGGSLEAFSRYSLAHEERAWGSDWWLCGSDRWSVSPSTALVIILSDVVVWFGIFALNSTLVASAGLVGLIVFFWCHVYAQVSGQIGLVEKVQSVAGYLLSGVWVMFPVGLSFPGSALQTFLSAGWLAASAQWGVLAYFSVGLFVVSFVPLVVLTWLLWDTESDSWWQS